MIQWILETIQEAAARWDVSAWALERTLRCESMNYSWAVITGQRLGLAGEKGIAQLHPQGMLPVFYAMGYDTPYSVWQAVDFVARMFAAGEAHQWTCYRMLGI